MWRTVKLYVYDPSIINPLNCPISFLQLFQFVWWHIWSPFYNEKLWQPQPHFTKKREHRKPVRYSRKESVRQGKLTLKFTNTHCEHTRELVNILCKNLLENTIKRWTPGGKSNYWYKKQNNRVEKTDCKLYMLWHIQSLI